MTISSLTSATTAYSYSTKSVDPMTQAILDAVAKATGQATSTDSGSGVSISTTAKIAAANAADNAKDFTTLTAEVRTALDKGDTGLDEMSGRALSAIVLNRGGAFSRSEIAAAKAELNGRARQDFAALAGGNVIGGLGSYNEQLVSQYDAMSAEEREARGWTPAMRNSAEAFVTGAQQLSSLFDALDQEDRAY